MVSPDKGANTCSYFLPGGEKIVYSSTSALPGDCPERIKIPGQNYVWPLWPYDIYIADSDGKNAKALTDNPEYDAEPVVNAAGTRIVFGSKRGGDFDVYTMNMDGSDVKRLTTEYGYDGGPWWSPDGSMIAWRAYYPSTEAEKASWKDSMDKNYIVPVPLDLWVMKSDGTEKRRIVSNGAVNWAPSWHPDGKRLVFSSNMDDWKESQKRFGHNFELYMVDIDGKNLKRLTYNDNFDSFPMFSPDGRKLVFGSNRTKERPRQTDIFLADWAE
jgi:Tol biopolymer transport system component